MAAASSSSRRIRQGTTYEPPQLDASGKILPVPGRRNILITSALPYVNNAPHLGNIIGSTLSADVFARYARTAPDHPQVLYICGTDEYGTTTETKALEEGLTPQQLCDKYHEVHKDAYEWFDIGFDYFGRTTTPKQTEHVAYLLELGRQLTREDRICQEIFMGLWKNKHLIEHEMAQVYCEKDSRFLADRFVEGVCPKCGAGGARGDQCDTCCQTLDAIDLIDKRCKLCGTEPQTRLSRHLFLDLPTLQPRISEWYSSQSGGRRGAEGGADGQGPKRYWSSNGRAFTEAWLRDGLKERCLTRDLKWGVPVPLEGWEDKVMYVWFDAPIGYPSITANYTKDWRKWWQDPKEVTLYQFMGKDNVPFHTILFPAYLLGSGQTWTMLNHISTTEYLQYESVKFSKSNNVGVFGQNARDTGVPSEVWRYYLLATRPESNDSQFTWTDFINKANAELLNNFGNFVNRIVKFCNARFGGVVPDPLSFAETGNDPAPEGRDGGEPEVGDREAFAPADQVFVAEIDDLLAQYLDAMESLKLRLGLQLVMFTSARGNQYLQDNGLNNALLASSPRRCAEVVRNALNLVYLLSAMVQPFMPTTAAQILKQLDAPQPRIPRRFGTDLLPGHKLADALYLFRKIEPEKANIWRKQYGGNKPVDPVAAAPSTSNAAGSTAAGAPASGGGPKEKKVKKVPKVATADVPAYTGPKTPELLELEKRVAEQGLRVRDAKAGKLEGGSPTADEVARLLALKKELAELVTSLSQVQVTTAPE